MMLPNEPESSKNTRHQYDSSKTDAQANLDGLQPLETATDLLCPNCNITLRGGKLDEFPVAFCPGCHGVLIDHQGIANVIAIRRSEYQGVDRTPNPFDPSALEIQRNCPNCGQRMEVYPYGGPGNVVLDSCRSCHLLWLDHGEISTIVQAPGLRQD